MSRSFLPVFLICLLAACAPQGGGSGSGDNEGDGGGDAPPAVGPTANQAPESLAQNLSTFEFSDDGQTLNVTMYAIDTTPVTAQYARNPKLDQPGYVAYSVQEDVLDRFFVALGAQSPDGSAESVIVSDGGQFNRILPGIGYRRNGEYDPPTLETNKELGQVSYVGEYVGVTNLTTASGPELINLPPNPPDTLPDLPGQPYLTNGTIFLNVNFADNAVNGEIMERVLISPLDGEPVLSLEDQVLIITGIDQDGYFQGIVERPDDMAKGVRVGSYGGVFTGEDAQYVTGGVATEWEFDEEAENSDTVLENGGFLLTQCGREGEDTETGLCPLVKP